MHDSDRADGTTPVEDQSTWLGLSFALNACAAILIAVLILLPSPFGTDLIYENSKTYYDHYEAECRKAEGERATILNSLENPATRKQRAEQHRQKATNEADITRECDMAAQYLAAESAASMDRSGWVTMIATAIAAILVAFTLVYTARTLRDAKNATHQARLATVAAEKTTDATREAAADAKYVSIEQSAPFLRVENVKIANFNKGQSIVNSIEGYSGFAYKIDVKNVGTSVAFNVQSSGKIWSDRFLGRSTRGRGISSIGPGETDLADTVCGIAAIEHNSTSRTLGDDETIFFALRVEFSDSFGVRRYIESEFSETHMETKDRAKSSFFELHSIGQPVRMGRVNCGDDQHKRKEYFPPSCGPEAKT